MQPTGCCRGERVFMDFITEVACDLALNTLDPQKTTDLSAQCHNLPGRPVYLFTLHRRISDVGSLKGTRSRVSAITASS
jgi:hypothetical protein